MDAQNNMPQESKIIIFQSGRDMNGEELADVEMTLDNFLKGWNTHGSALAASYAIPYDRFVVIAVDENVAATSGCSLDSLTQTMKELENKHKFGFMDHMKVSYNLDGEIITLPLMEFKRKVKNNEIPDHATIFHNGVTNLGEFEEDWEVPLNESWVKDLIQMEA